MSKSRRRVIRFLNTYDPVTSIYSDIFPALLLAGFDVEVYLSSCEYREGRAPLESRVSVDGLKCRRMVACFRIASSQFRKGLAAIFFSVGASLSTMFRRQVDVNVFLSQPPLFSFWGIVLQRVRRQRYVCLLMDIYPDCAIEMGAIRRNSIVGLISHRISRYIWAKASAIIVIGRCMRDLVIAAGVPPDRIHVVPNWFDEQRIGPVARDANPMRSRLGLEDDFIVLYSGNMGRSHYFDDLLLAARDLVEHPDIKFVFIGKGAARKEIENFRDHESLSNIIILESQKESQLGYSLGLGDVHFVSLRENFTGLIVPSKAYGAFAAGRPVIYQGEPEGEIARLIVSNGIGRVIDQSDRQGLVAAIKEYHGSAAMTAEEGSRARAFAEGAASRRVGVNSYVRVLEGIGG